MFKRTKKKKEKNNKIGSTPDRNRAVLPSQRIFPRKDLSKREREKEGRKDGSSKIHGRSMMENK